jgi:hypothetical protein
LLKQIAAMITLSGFLAVQAGIPQRTVNGNEITSQRDPKIQIRLPNSVQYVGADRWELYDVADCELHAFVEADANKNVQRLYWIQFEGYLPTKPALQYTYDSPQHRQIGGLDFYVDTWVRSMDAATRPGSDREHIQKLVALKGYKMPAGMMYVRLVHLLDEQKRRELMIVYGEDLAATRLTASDLSAGGSAFSRWPEIAQALIARAEQRIVLEHRPNP